MLELSADGERVVVDYGPVHMNIQAWSGGDLNLDVAKKGGQRATELLDEVAQYQAVIKQKSRLLRVSKGLPPVVSRMIESSKIVDDPDFTPLAVVAGTFADFVADYMLEQGAGKVIVDNGGDIAIRVPAGESIRIGIRSDLSSSTTTHVITINGDMGIGGVCTSGLGGRSLTLGIASAAVALSPSASLADAAATLLGNATFIDSPKVKRVLAESIYPDTDIRGLLVVTEVEPLSGEEIEKALSLGEKKAQELLNKQVITGAFIAVQGETRNIGNIGALISPLNRD